MNLSVPQQATLRKVAWRLLPFLCLLYIFNILDRANAGFARLQMQSDLSMLPDHFDLGYGLFYIGYLLFEVPSNLLMRKVGARIWISRIMISWGIISCATLYVRDAWSFSLVRIFLGFAEAGFFPGIILYLSYWFPARQRAGVTAYFMMAIALASVVGNPLSGVIMQYLDQVLGLRGWQWLFLLEGLPSILLGGMVLILLPDGPANARWLDPAERDWLSQHMQNEELARQQTHKAHHLQALLSRPVWLLILVYFPVAVGANAAGAYLPTLLKDSFPDLSTVQLGLLTALPHVCSVVGMILFSWSSDRTGDRRIHVSAAALLASVGWGLSAWGPTPGVALLGYCLAVTGMMSMLPVFWALPTMFLSGAAAAGGIALINSVANIGGFLGPTILGKGGLWAPAVIMLVGSFLALCVRQQRENVVAGKGVMQRVERSI